MASYKPLPMIAVFLASSFAAIAQDSPQPGPKCRLDVDRTEVRPFESVDLLVIVLNEGQDSITAKVAGAWIQHRTRGERGLQDWIDYSPAGLQSLKHPQPLILKKGARESWPLTVSVNVGNKDPKTLERFEGHVFPRPGEYQLRAQVGDWTSEPVNVRVVDATAPNDVKALALVRDLRLWRYFDAQAVLGSHPTAEDLAGLKTLLSSHPGSLYADYAVFAQAIMAWRGIGAPADLDAAARFLKLLVDKKTGPCRMRAWLALCHLTLEKDPAEAKPMFDALKAANPGPHYRRQLELLESIPKRGTGSSVTRESPEPPPPPPGGTQEGWSVKLLAPKKLSAPWVPCRMALVVTNARNSEAALPEAANVALYTRMKEADRWALFERGGPVSSPLAFDETERKFKGREVKSFPIHIYRSAKGSHPFAKPGEYEVMAAIGDAGSPVALLEVGVATKDELVQLEAIRTGMMLDYLSADSDGWRSPTPEMLKKMLEIISGPKNSPYSAWLSIGLAAVLYQDAVLNEGMGKSGAESRAAAAKVWEDLTNGSGPASAEACYWMARLVHIRDAAKRSELLRSALSKSPQPGLEVMIKELLPK